MAGESSLTLTYQGLLTSTLLGYLDSNKFFDNVADATPLLAFLMGGDRIRFQNGGQNITVAIMHELNTTAKSYSNYDILDTTAQEGFTRAIYDWKQYSVSIAINGNELTSNMGDAELFNLLDAKAEQAEISLADKLSTDLYTDGTGNSSKELGGLAVMNDPSPTASTYASINRANNTAWRNGFTTSVGAAASNLLSNLRTQYNNAAQGKAGMGSKPDGIFTTQTVHEAFEALMFPFLQYQGNATSDNSVNAGLSNLRYKNASVEWDADCPSGEMHILNSKHAFLVVHPDRNMAMADGGFQKPVDQDALVTQILAKLEFATNANSKISGLSGIT